MAAIPRHHSALEDLIYAAYEKKQSKTLRLSRLGASGIGDECVRSIWYDWRGFYNDSFKGRILRLFQTGHLQEARIVQDLKDAGLEVWEVDADTGQQWVYTAASGHFVCKPDGVVRGVPGAEKTPHLLEIKTTNANGYKELSSRGVKVAKPEHYYQMQSGMWLARLKRALYVALRKDDEQYYIERVEYDEECIADIERKLHELTYSMSPPPRIAEKESDWRCKFCDAKDVCWNDAAPLINCRTCQHSSIKDEGGWVCDKQSILLSSSAQVKGCDLWTKF